MVIYGNCTITADANGDTQGNTLRMVVVWHKSPSGGAIPTFNTIFGETNDSGTVTTTNFDKVQFRKTSEFQILADEIVVCNLQSGMIANSDVNIQDFYIDRFINLRGRETQYLTTTSPAAYTDIQTGGILVYFRANSSTVGTFAIANRIVTGKRSI